MNQSIDEDFSLGTLSDEEIKELCTNGNIITENFIDNNIKQACYELRASNIYYDLANGNKKYVLNDGEYILLKPKQPIVIITMESLDLPDNVLGRILTKGMLFSIGLLPVNTYADPGFIGKLGIVFNNVSNNYIKIIPGQSIAKIEFSRLQKKVARDYSGQHGYQTEIWPIKNDLILTPDEIKKDNRINNSVDEIELSYGKEIGNLVRRIFVFERYLILASVAYLLFSIILIAAMLSKGANAESIISPVTGVILGVLANIIFGFGMNTITNLKGRK